MMNIKINENSENNEDTENSEHAKNAVTSQNGRSVREPLWTRGFVALLVTQFMVSLNDNLFRWLIIPIGKHAVGWSEHPDQIRMIGSVVFLAPFLAFTAYAGYFCDRFNKRSVIIGCKIAELIIVLFGTWAILTQSVPFMLGVLLCLGAQSAFFSPAKYSSLPSIISKGRISEANGYYSMTTMVACIGGQLLGGILFVLTTLTTDDGTPTIGGGGLTDWWLWAGTIIGVAVMGLLSSLFIPSMKAVDRGAKFPLNPFRQTLADLRFLFRYKTVFWAAMGSSFFWGLGALAQVNIDKFGDEILHIRQDSTMLLLVMISIGLAAGAMIAGRCSRGRIEKGLVPIGAFFIVLFSFLLALTPRPVTADGAYASVRSISFILGAGGLVLLGTSSGIFDIPLLALIQTESPEAHRGRIMAAYNFYSFTAMAAFSLLQGVLSDPGSVGLGFLVKEGYRGLSATGIWGFCGLISLPVFYFSLKAFWHPALDFIAFAAVGNRGEKID